ncbi:inositol monophosphatase family protein [Myxosarcina sp. GI1]|uniref:inositol monophosphatase family protein n=1 Tax=Myxosarcina sp. GI1 TaxID=1541065 RepID=UPI0005607ABC|nr:inositol monophosphatase family protein [Myxosarcina sp. GI1]
MSSQSKPREILCTLLPHLRVAAGYADYIQNKIAVLPAKDGGDNFFATALTDADLSIQTFVEVALLGTFPNIRFHGEEHEQSRNTKYFRAIDLGEPDDYLITLDPIDGTKFYLDGHDNYQIILAIVNADDFEAVIAISPAIKTYYYALRGEGAYWGTLDKDLEACSPLKIANPEPNILLGWEMGHLKASLTDKYGIIDVQKDYSATKPIPNTNGIFTSNKVAGAILRRGKFIDGGALAFLAREAGCIVSTFNGSELPRLSACQNLSLPGLIIATSTEVHQDLVTACQNLVKK